MKIPSEDESFLLAAIARADAVLILGAGASSTSANAKGEPVKMANALARTIAERAGLSYEGEKLSEVLSATRGQYLSDVQIREILVQEYKGVTPAKELENLLRISWRRLYTWNIDDALENISIRTAQRRRTYNGKIDKVAEYEWPLYLHIVYLHGQVTKPEHEFILTEEEYAHAIKDEQHQWYRRAAQNYLAFCPIFIGTQLDEPILMAELERAKRQDGTAVGRGYLITPNALTSIKQSSLKAKGIVHIQASVADFSQWLSQRFPQGNEPKDIIASTNRYNDPNIIGSLSTEELQIARFLRPITLTNIKERLLNLPSAHLGRMARQYLRGFPVTWQIAASDIPVWLKGTDGLYTHLVGAIDKADRLVMVIGQSGSGKTTATRMCLLRLLAERPAVVLYEVSGDVRSIGSVFRLVGRLHANETCVLYMDDLFLYGDDFKSDLENLAGHRITVISSARKGEWREHFARHLGTSCDPYEFQRFGPEDYPPLIERLAKYVPSPSFTKLSNSEKIDKLAGSRSQLLIALREATESQNFDDVMTHEYENLPDGDTRHLFIIVGIATLARVGIAIETAAEVYKSRAAQRTFEAALAALEGIVEFTERHRLVGRHELYVRHIIENVASYAEFADAVTGILKTFTKYQIPVIKSVSRQDSYLFKFLLTHNFILSNARKHHVPAEGRRIYEAFEVEFQLDGQYWLQYGLYLVALGQLEPALHVLLRSIQAYPDNLFAVHAHADLQLRIAKQRSTYDSTTRNLIGEAVEALLKQDARRELVLDQYPIVTLANGHIGALVKHGRLAEAKKAAAQYFERLKELDRQISNQLVNRTKERLLRFVTLNQWAEHFLDAGQGRAKERKWK